MESSKTKKKRNIKKMSNGTAFEMLRNQALFASARPTTKLKKKKIGRSKSRTGNTLHASLNLFNLNYPLTLDSKFVQDLCVFTSGGVPELTL
jgi:hypothetical protein